MTFNPKHHEFMREFFKSVKKACPLQSSQEQGIAIEAALVLVRHLMNSIHDDDDATRVFLRFYEDALDDALDQAASHC